jgi:hypothetical protein
MRTGALGSAGVGVTGVTGAEPQPTAVAKIITNIQNLTCIFPFSDI